MITDDFTVIGDDAGATEAADMMRDMVEKLHGLGVRGPYVLKTKYGDFRLVPVKPKPRAKVRKRSERAPWAPSIR